MPDGNVRVIEAVLTLGRRQPWLDVVDGRGSAGEAVSWQNCWGRTPTVAATVPVELVHDDDGLKTQCIHTIKLHVAHMCSLSH